MYFSAALAVFLTGVTEPLEFMFMFAAVPLYVIYAVIQGAAFAMADILPLRVHSFGNIELLTRTPLAIKAGLGGDLINFVLMVIIFGAVTYFLANFLIKNLITQHLEEMETTTMITAKKSHLARLVQVSSISKSRKLSTYLVVNKISKKLMRV